MTNISAFCKPNKRSSGGYIGEPRMLNLISRQPAGVIAKIGLTTYQQHCGMLTSPRNGKPPDRAIECGVKWAADNDCFKFYDPDRILRALKRWQHKPGCLYFNAPDVVKDGTATLERFWHWQPIIKGYGLPVAFTLQNGTEYHTVPFDECDALFIGGDNLFKYSRYVAGIVAEARARGLWVHNGRVNTPRAIRYSWSIGCNSFDGTGYTIDLQKIVNHMPHHQVFQPRLPLLE